MTLPLTPARNVPALLPDVLRVRQDLQIRPDPGVSLFRPLRRRNSKGALIGPDGEPLGPPPSQFPVTSTRIWPWQCGATIGTRSTVVSKAFTAPACIASIAFRLGTGGNPEGGLGLFFAADAGDAQVSGPAGNVPNGTPVFDDLSFASSAETFTDELRQVISAVTDGQGNRDVLMRPKYIIEAPQQFFLKVTVRAAGGGGFDFKGEIVVVQGSTIEDIYRFTG